MPKPLVIQLTDKQQRELESVRDRDPRPYMREHAAAILKIASGHSGRATALHGLLKRRSPRTISRWFRRYQANGIPGLVIQPGRGRKPSFSPSLPRH